MITNKDELKEVLKYEKNQYGGIPSLWRLLSLFKISDSSIIWSYQRRLRIWEYHHNKNHKIRCLINKVKCNRIGRRYGIHMHPNNFDTGLKILHLGSILVNAEARVGKNCMIHINTALVATGGVSNSPTLGDNCALGVGAKLIGGIKLGNKVVVGAGAVVTKSFEEDHITLGGVPAKVISKKAII